MASSSRWVHRERSVDLGRVLTEEPVGVFVASTLPRALVEYLEIADRSLAGHR